jgi:chaperonin cofactor prefoldin
MGCASGPDVAPSPKNPRPMNTNIVNAAVVGTFLAFTACSEAPKSAEQMEQKVDKAMDDLRAGKEEMGRELRELREKMAVELAIAEEKLKDPALKAEQRTEWEAYKAEVTDQIDRLDANLSDVEKATAEGWDNVKADTRKTADDVGNWFQRQAEKVDRKTDADKDHDGH